MKEQVCVYCGNLTGGAAEGDLCSEHYYAFHYGAIKEDDPKYDAVKAEYEKSN